MPTYTRRSLPSASLAILYLLPGAALAGPLLPSISRGTIAVHLESIATGLAAPDYAISAPGDASRLYVVEQNGLLLALQNGNLAPTPVLDIRSRIVPPLNIANANDERGFLGLAFHPGFSTPTSAGHRTLCAYTSELMQAGGVLAGPGI